jgi:hypothetical protein
MGKDDDMFGDEDDFLEQSPDLGDDDDLDCDDLDCDEIGIDYAGSDAGVQAGFQKPPVVSFASNPRSLQKTLRGQITQLQYDKENSIAKIDFADGRTLTIKP